MNIKDNGVATIVVGLIEKILDAADIDDISDLVAALGRVKGLIRTLHDFKAGKVSAKQALTEAEKLAGAVKSNDAEADEAFAKKFEKGD